MGGKGQGEKGTEAPTNTSIPGRGLHLAEPLSQRPEHPELLEAGSPHPEPRVDLPPLLQAWPYPMRTGGKDSAHTGATRDHRLTASHAAPSPQRTVLVPRGEPRPGHAAGPRPPSSGTLPQATAAEPTPSRLCACRPLALERCPSSATEPCPEPARTQPGAGRAQAAGGGGTSTDRLVRRLTSPVWATVRTCSLT